MAANIELIQKETKKKNIFGFFKFDSWASFFAGVLVLMLVLYGGFWGYGKYLERENDAIDVEIINLNAKRDFDLENEVLGLNNKIKDIKSIMKQRFFLSDLFSLLEKLVVARSYFDRFSVSVTDTANGILNLQVQSGDYSDAASLIKIFEGEKLFKNVSVSGIGAEDDGVRFSVDINFNPASAE